jgi:hypothetical protein
MVDVKVTGFKNCPFGIADNGHGGTEYTCEHPNIGTAYICQIDVCPLKDNPVNIVRVNNED